MEIFKAQCLCVSPAFGELKPALRYAQQQPDSKDSSLSLFFRPSIPFYFPSLSSLSCSFSAQCVISLSLFHLCPEVHFTLISASYPPTPPSPSLPPSISPLPRCPLYISVSPREEGEQPSHSSSTCNRVQAAPSASPPLLSRLSSLSEEGYRGDERSTGEHLSR